MKKLGFGAVACVSALLLAACGDKDEKKETQTEPAAPAATQEAAVTPAPAPAAATNKVNVYNWSDYIGEKTNENFTAATGIAVQYDVFELERDPGSQAAGGQHRL